AQTVDSRIVARPFHPAVPGTIVRIAVSVLFTVGLIVFVVVTDQIVQGESVVRRDEVDAVIWPAPVVLIEIGTAGQSITDFTDEPFVAPPEAAHRIAKLSIPFRERQRKISYVITAIANVPRLGNQFYLRQNGILLNAFEESVKFVHAAPVSR